MKQIKIKGMNCQHCVAAVTGALGKIDGIQNVKVDLATGLASFDETKPVDEKAVLAAIRKAGYDVIG